MYAFAILTIHLFMIWIMTGLTTAHMDMFKEYRELTRDNDLVTLRDGFNQYYLEKHTIPYALSDITGATGYEHLASATNTSVGYARSFEIADAKWRFQRAILYSHNSAGATTLTTRLSQNGCSSSPSSAFHNEDRAWCGKSDWNWFVFENRSVFNAEMATQRARQQRTLQKFASYYTAYQAFPNKDRFNAPMTAGTGYAIATLAGANALALNCISTYRYMAIPIDCEDMFDVWGNRLTYVYHSDHRISIVSSTPFKNWANSNITIGTDLDLS
jgi:hypothetical protein